MTALTVWKFDTVDGADIALTRLQQLQREQLIEVLDGAVVTYPQGAKKPKTRQLTTRPPLAPSAAHSGACSLA